MKKQFLEAGKIVNTHGIRGEVKIQPWSNAPDFLCSFENVYIGEKPYKIKGIRVHKGNAIASLQGVETVDDAVRLKNKVVLIKREDAPLEEGEFFIQDLLGLKAIDADTGSELGTVHEVLPLPSGNIYVIKGEREILVPAVPAFIKETNIDAGFIKIRLIDGM